jgi:Hypothetical protein (DUF2513).
MKLNHDAVRFVLLTIESDVPMNGEVFNDHFHNKGFNNDEIDYAIKQLVDSGHIDAINQSTFTESLFAISGITWIGHGLLDNIRDNNVWGEAKKVAGKFASVSIDILSQIAVQVIGNAISGR